MKQRVVRAPEELIPFLEQALVSFPGPWLFPDETGAIKRAGIVTGYKHTCRKKGCGHEEMATDQETMRCPKDRRKLWVKPVVRPIRFHDLRHTTASLLIMSGANLPAVQSGSPRS